jgi:hypothetical protein
MNFFFALLTLAVVIPLVVYFSTKLGRYAYLRATWLFRKNHQTHPGDEYGDEA